MAFMLQEEILLQVTYHENTPATLAINTQFIAFLTALVEELIFDVIIVPDD